MFALFETGSPYVDQADLELNSCLPASTYQVLGITVYTSIWLKLVFCFFFF